MGATYGVVPNTNKGRNEMKRLWAILAITVSSALLLFISYRVPGTHPAQSSTSPFVPSCLPGEFEKQQAMWVMWPSDIYKYTDYPVSPAMIAIIKALVPYIPVNIISSSQAEAQAIQGLLKAASVSDSNVHYFVIYHQTIWTRDVGPIFIKDQHNQLCVVDFGFNNFNRGGDPDFINSEDLVDIRAAGILGLPLIKSKLVSEGGAIESNGRGTIMTTEAVALNRNPSMSKRQIEDEYKRVLGVKKVIWLKKGLAEEDGITGGHVDEMARFVDPHTILLAQVLPGDKDANRVAMNSYSHLEENYKILWASTDQDGKRFRIIRIPMPPTLYGETINGREAPVRSYLNYVVTNGAVLVPMYWKPGRSDLLKTTEEQIKGTFQALFPGHEIIGIDVENINLWGGGIHCVTQHMPSV